MKTTKDLMKKATIFLTGFLFVTVTVTAQDGKEKADKNNVKQLLDSKEYIFKAQSTTSLRGSFQQLTSEYDLRLYGDSVVSYLPYFGRAYTAPLDSRESGIQFTSTQFDYNVSGRKNGWDVTLRPKDVSSIQQMILNVTKSGRASLQVTSTNREPISFNGIIVGRQ